MVNFAASSLPPKSNNGGRNRFPAFFFSPWPRGGTGVALRSQIFAKPRSESPNSFATLTIGSRQTRSYKSRLVSSARLESDMGRHLKRLIALEILGEPTIAQRFFSGRPESAVISLHRDSSSLLHAKLFAAHVRREFGGKSL